MFSMKILARKGLTHCADPNVEIRYKHKGISMYLEIKSTHKWLSFNELLMTPIV